MELVQGLFTQEDVKGLRHIASLLKGEAKQRLALSLADRIEAILPKDAPDGTL
jgi:hypothetical protein